MSKPTPAKPRSRKTAGADARAGGRTVPAKRGAAGAGRTRRRGAGAPAAKRWRTVQEVRWAVQHWATRMNVKMPYVHLRAMRTKWASMSARRRLTINADVLRIPADLAEYVIVHELVHLLAPNHGRVFRAFMYAYLPDWEDRDRRLRQWATRLAGAATSK